MSFWTPFFDILQSLEFLVGIVMNFLVGTSSFGLFSLFDSEKGPGFVVSLEVGISL